MMLATLPAAMESAPSPEPTERSSRMTSGAGRAPARSSSARSCASCTENLPLIWPLPPTMGSRMSGALMTLPSRTMANRRFTFCVVASAKRLPPAASKRKLTIGSLVRVSKDGWASTRVSPPTMTFLRMRYMRGLPWASASSAEGINCEPGGTRPAMAWVTVVLLSTNWKVSLAVLPSRRLMRSGSTPGTCTRMRSSPWRWMVGSRTPVSSMRRRTISMDCSTAEARRSRTASSVMERVMRPPSPRSVGMPGSRFESSSSARSTASAVLMVTPTVRPWAPRPV